ncbi:MAG TPA: hypothetical protein VGX76_06395, partial [Pirellulales bacterium]|nr:hypothetical protein [Pirellulales bacterium]
RSTHEELSRWRAELAAKNWRLILPDATANQQDTADVLIYGTVSPRALGEVARTAEEQVARIRKLFKVPADEPLIKGRLTLYVFEKRFDYGEVGTMLEHREIPAAWRGHWHYHPVDTYACVLLPSDGKIAGLIAEQIVGAYVASLGNVPPWFAEGTARAVAARFDPKDPRVRAWDDQTVRAWQATDKPEGFLTGSLQQDDGDALSFGFVKSLMIPPTRHAALIAALQQGTPFETAFAKVYGGSPRQIAANWSPRASKRGR